MNAPRLPEPNYGVVGTFKRTKAQLVATVIVGVVAVAVTLLAIYEIIQMASDRKVWADGVFIFLAFACWVIFGVTYSHMKESSNHQFDEAYREAKSSYLVREFLPWLETEYGVTFTLGELHDLSRGYVVNKKIDGELVHLTLDDYQALKMGADGKDHENIDPEFDLMVIPPKVQPPSYPLDRI